MGLFDRKKETPIPAKIIDESMEMLALVQTGRINEAIEREMKKSFSLFDFQSPENEVNGGHFGQEFNLRPTAGRVKALHASEPWVFATSSLISRKLSGVKFQVVNTKTGDVDKNHPANKILNGENAIQPIIHKRWSGYLDLTLGGNYFEIIDEKFQYTMHVPVESATIVMRKANTEAERKLIEKFGPYEALQINDATNNMPKQTIPWEYVIHHKFPNPFNPFYGLSMYVAASRPILLDRHKNEFEMAFYLRGATNAGVVEITEDISKSRMERLMKTFEQTFTGRRNWWRTQFLPKGTKWVNAGLTMNEMQHLEGLRENRLTLLAVLGIPPSMLGIVQDVNRSTSEIQEAVFYTNTIIPLAEFIASGYNHSYVFRNMFKGNFMIVPDFSGVVAINGSIATRGERAKAVDNIATINEQREIAGFDPLPVTDPRGSMFVAQLMKLDPNFQTFAALPTAEPTEPVEPTDPGTESNDSKAVLFARFKANLTIAQERLERVQMAKHIKAVNANTQLALDMAKQALRDGRNPANSLRSNESDRLDEYKKTGLVVLRETMDQGFELGRTQTRSFTHAIIKAERLNPDDELALEAIRQRTADGKRRQLDQRNIDAFKGFDKTQTERIMQIVENGLAQGQSYEEIAKTIETRYGEAYGDQAFTIARTEVLTATSEGVKWNHDALKEIFSKVNKQWFHVGDVGTNPDARSEHADFELVGDDGVVPSDYVYVNPKTGGELLYPRDPNAGADDNVNCRCGWVTVIPDDAISSATSILNA
jgi:HK97 family phage portal protein